MSSKYKSRLIKFDSNDYDWVTPNMLNHNGRGSLCRILNRKNPVVNPPNFSGRRNCSLGAFQCGETEIFNHCLMHLEPRLQEYVKKRDYYRKNRIEPTVPLVKEFRMTKKDLKKVCMFDKCNKDQSKMDAGMLDGFDHPSLTACFDNTAYGNNISYTNMSDPKGREYRNFNKFGRDVIDPQRCVKDWRGTPCHKPLKFIDRRYYPNCGKACANGCRCDRLCDTGYMKQLGYGFDLDYDYPIDINDFNRNNREAFGDVDNTDFLNRDNLGKSSRLDANNTDFLDRDHLGKSTRLRYGDEEIDHESYLRCNGVTTRAGQSCASVMDSQMKVVIPNARARCTKDENINHSFYKAVPYMGQGSGRGDIDLNSVIKFGETERGSKQKKHGGITIDRFEELPWDLQCVDHVVMPFPRGGYDTRHLDKYSRRNAHYVV